MKSSSKATSSVRSQRRTNNTNLVVGLVLGALLAGVLMMALQRSEPSQASRVFACDDISIPYPATWHVGVQGGACVLSNAPHDRWPGIYGFEENGIVTLSIRQEKDDAGEPSYLAPKDSLKQYVSDVAKRLESTTGTNRELSFSYDVQSLKSIDIPAAEAYEITAHGGHYAREERMIYLSPRDALDRPVYLATIGSTDAKLREQAMNILAKIAY